MIQAMEAEDDRIASQGLLQFYLAHVSNGSLLEESFKAMAESAKQEVLHLMELLRPWTASTTSAEQMLQAVTDTYRKLVGDPNDPAFMDEIREGVRKHEALQKEALFRETDEQRITRLISERDLKRSSRR